MTDRLVLIYYDESPIVAVPDGGKLIPTVLDKYAKQYAMDREHLSGRYVDLIPELK